MGIYREFKVLEAMRKAAGDRVELQLIVNNWCRQDCAIAGIHAVSLNNASQKGSRGFPLDYCSIFCNHIRLLDPVNYVRANWIRPEDLHYYASILAFGSSENLSLSLSPMPRRIHKSSYGLLLRRAVGAEEPFGQCFNGGCPNGRRFGFVRAAVREHACRGFHGLSGDVSEIVCRRLGR